MPVKFQLLICCKQLIEAGDSNVKDISDEETSTQEATTTASEDESTTVEETTAE